MNGFEVHCIPTCESHIQVHYPETQTIWQWMTGLFHRWLCVNAFKPQGRTTGPCLVDLAKQYYVRSYRVTYVHRLHNYTVYLV